MRVKATKTKKTMNQSLLESEMPEKPKDLLSYWRSLKDVIDDGDMRLKPYKDRMKEVAAEIQSKLSIDDDANKSETISLDGCATAYKTREIGAQVTDFEAFQNFCTRNNTEFVMRKQLNLGGIKELYRMIMEGDVPMPKSVNFTTFEKITIRKRS